jgi:hypothetical protein
MTNLYLLKSGIKPTVVGEVHTETLFHFNCCECERWWTVGDFKMDQQVFCVYCGEEYSVLGMKSAPNLDRGYS